MAYSGYYSSSLLSHASEISGRYCRNS